MSRLSAKTVLFIVLASLATLMVVAGCSRSGPATSESSPTTRAPLPAGWTLYTTADFEIGAPDTWINVEVTPEVIDAMIENMGDSNPDIVRTLKALKGQEAIKFCSMDPEALVFGTNINVVRAVRLTSLDTLESQEKKQLASAGYSFVSSVRGTLNGDKTATLVMKVPMDSGDGTSITVLQEQLVIDHRGYNYFITLSYAEEDAGECLGLLDQVASTFLIK